MENEKVVEFRDGKNDRPKFSFLCTSKVAINMIDRKRSEWYNAQKKLKKKIRVLLGKLKNGTWMTWKFPWSGKKNGI